MPIFNNYTWIVILLAVMIYIVKDWRNFKEFDSYTYIMHISSFVSGICVVDALAGGAYLNMLIPNYVCTLLPVSIVISLVCRFGINFEDIKNSDQSDDEKRSSYKKQIKYIIYLIIACIWMYLGINGISVLSMMRNIFN